MKKRISISLDDNVIKGVDKLCKQNGFEIKRSTAINRILVKYLKIKGKKNGK